MYWGRKAWQRPDSNCLSNLTKNAKKPPTDSTATVNPRVKASRSEGQPRKKMRWTVFESSRQAALENPLLL